MKNVINLIMVSIQGVVGLLIVLDVWSIKAIAWTWLVNSAITLLLLFIAGMAMVAKEP